MKKGVRNVMDVDIVNVREKRNQGLIIVYTGDGKGKTTASLGMALRTVGWGGKVLVIQFVKAWKTGEHKAIERFIRDVQIIPMGEGFVGIMGDRKKKEEHRKAAQKAFAKVKTEIKNNKWDLIILDEINGAIEGGLVTLEQILELIKLKPEKLTLVLTGRNARKEIIEKADLVTEMKKIKHPFDLGILAKKGIDF